MQTVFVMHNCQTSLTAKRNTDVLHRSHGRATHVSREIASICHLCLLQQSEWIAMLTFSDLSASIEALPDPALPTTRVGLEVEIRLRAIAAHGLSSVLPHGLLQERALPALPSIFESAAGCKSLMYCKSM